MFYCHVQLYLVAAILLLTQLNVKAAKEVTITVNSIKWLHLVHDKFLSLTLNPRHLLYIEKLGHESSSMAKALSPAYFRVGGPESDLLQFAKGAENADRISVTESQWLALNKFVADCNLDLIVCLNPLQRVKGVWDSRSTLELISTSDRNGYNLTWQLGFESQKLRNIDEGISGAELGRDIVRLRKILDSFPRYKGSDIIGPDITSMKNYEEVKFIKDYLMESGDALNAITWHPQFADDKAEDEDVLQSMSMIYNGLDSLLYGKNQIPKASQYLTEKPMWIAESQANCYNGEFSDALIWARRLGTAARLGFYVFMHNIQDFAFNQPTPDFWVSLLYKNLVGRAVLDTRVLSGNRTTLQVFSHCTAVEEIPLEPIIAENFAYERGSITLFGSNSLDEPIKISLASLVKNEKVHLYVLTGGSNGSDRSRVTLLNGQELKLSPSGDLPVLSPKVRHTNRNIVYTVPAKSVFFIVLPEAKVRTCTTYPGTTIDENNSLMKRLRQRKTNSENLEFDNVLIRDRDDEERSKEFDGKEVYVQFIDRRNLEQRGTNGVKPLKGRSSVQLYGTRDLNLEQRYGISRGKSSVLRNKPVKNANSVEFRGVRGRIPLKDDMATTNVKYVTYSDSSWLPKIPTNTSHAATEEIIQTLNNTFKGYIDPVIKSILEPDPSERREKYTVLANAIFGKRNPSSIELKIRDSDAAMEVSKNRRRRHAFEKPFRGTKPLLYNPGLMQRAELLTYPISNVHFQNLRGFNNKKLNKLNLLKEDSSSQEKVNEEENSPFPTGDVYLEMEDLFNRDTQMDGRTETGDFGGKYPEIERQPGQLFVDENINPNFMFNNEDELSEAEWNLRQGVMLDEMEISNKDSFLAQQNSRMPVNNNEVGRLLPQQLFFYKISNDRNLQDELSEFNDDKQIRKKENAVESLQNKSPDSWELNNYSDPQFRVPGRYRRQIAEEMMKLTDKVHDFGNQEINFNEDDQLTRLLKDITDDSEKLLDALENKEINSNEKLLAKEKIASSTEMDRLNKENAGSVVMSKYDDLVNRENIKNNEITFQPKIRFEKFNIINKEDSASDLKTVPDITMNPISSGEIQTTDSANTVATAEFISTDKEIINAEGIPINAIGESKTEMSRLMDDNDSDGPGSDNLNTPSSITTFVPFEEEGTPTVLDPKQALDRGRSLSDADEKGTGESEVISDRKINETIIFPIITESLNIMNTTSPKQPLENNEVKEKFSNNLNETIESIKLVDVEVPNTTAGKVIGNILTSKRNETNRKQIPQDRSNREKRRNEQIELLRARLTAYREHLNELTRRRMKHKREVDVEYYINKNHIFKKDNPYSHERLPIRSELDLQNLSGLGENGVVKISDTQKSTNIDWNTRNQIGKRPLMTSNDLNDKLNLPLNKQDDVYSFRNFQRFGSDTEKQRNNENSYVGNLREKMINGDVRIAREKMINGDVGNAREKIINEYLSRDMYENIDVIKNEQSMRTQKLKPGFENGIEETNSVERSNRVPMRDAARFVGMRGSQFPAVRKEENKMANRIYMRKRSLRDSKVDDVRNTIGYWLSKNQDTEENPLSHIDLFESSKEGFTLKLKDRGQEKMRKIANKYKKAQSDVQHLADSETNKDEKLGKEWKSNMTEEKRMSDNLTSDQKIKIKEENHNNNEDKGQKENQSKLGNINALTFQTALAFLLDKIRSLLSLIK
uniref:Heparanase n=1 Tax=Clastoptera arizonana TaxID=38151 RepID=A0A1B6D4U8_9HEMI